MLENGNPLDDSIVRASRFQFVLFFLVLLGATLLYVATDQPIIALVMPFLHGGWHTFFTGLWILRSDPQRKRAQICFAFYLAAAFWKSAAEALLVVFLYALAENRWGIQPDMKKITATMLVFAAGVILNTLIGFGAIYAAVVNKIRIWIHPHLGKQLHYDLNAIATLPPSCRQFNHAIFVIGTSLVAPMVVIATALVTIITLRNKPDDMSFLFSMIVLLFGCPLAMIPVYAWLSSRIIARHPRQCWPVHTLCQK